MQALNTINMFSTGERLCVVKDKVAGGACIRLVSEETKQMVQCLNLVSTR